LDKPHFLAKNILFSKQFETPMKMEITNSENVILAIAFSKNSHFGHFLSGLRP